MANIGLIGFNSVEYVEKLINIWNDKNCAVLIDVNTPYDAVIEQMKISKADICYIDNEVFLSYNLPLNMNIMNFKIYVSSYKEFKFLPDLLFDKYCFNYSENPAVVIFSSGTTGIAKGIILSHSAISKNADMIYDGMEIDYNHVLYIIKKISHSSALVGELLVALRYRLKILIGPLLIPIRIVLNNVIKNNISVLCVNPTIIRLIISELEKNKYDLDNLKKIFISGDKLYKKEINDIRRKLPKVEIYNMYGLSEAGPRVSMQNKNFCFENSVGVPLEGVEIKIIKDDGTICNYGEHGIIYVKTLTKYIGYINNKKKFNNPKEEWINTGDIGYIDINSELYIIDRIDDVVILNSHKIYPSDIENKIISVSNVEECVVLKRYNSILKKYSLTCAYVGNKIDIKKVIKELKKVLIDYEIPKAYINIEIIPKNKNGKRDIQKLMAILNKTS